MKIQRVKIIWITYRYKTSYTIRVLTDQLFENLGIYWHCNYSVCACLWRTLEILLRHKRIQLINTAERRIPHITGIRRIITSTQLPSGRTGFWIDTLVGVIWENDITVSATKGNGRALKDAPRICSHTSLISRVNVWVASDDGRRTWKDSTGPSKHDERLVSLGRYVQLHCICVFFRGTRREHRLLSMHRRIVISSRVLAL